VRGAMTGCVFELLEATAMLIANNMDFLIGFAISIFISGHIYLTINDLVLTAQQILSFSSFPPPDKPNGLSLVEVLDELYVVFLSVDIHFKTFRVCY
jgi:hypothetical protein